MFPEAASTHFFFCLWLPQWWTFAIIMLSYALRHAEQFNKLFTVATLIEILCNQMDISGEWIQIVTSLKTLNVTNPTVVPSSLDGLYLDLDAYTHLCLTKPGYTTKSRPKVSVLWLLLYTWPVVLYTFQSVKINSHIVSSCTANCVPTYYVRNSYVTHIFTILLDACFRYWCSYYE